MLQVAKISSTVIPWTQYKHPCSTTIGTSADCGDLQDVKVLSNDIDENSSRKAIQNSITLSVDYSKGNECITLTARAILIFLRNSRWEHE